jgi:hypothetical protein
MPSFDSILRAFEAVMGYRPGVKLCPAADRDHARDPRVYAHTKHIEGVICVAHAFESLTPAEKAGITAHECGHLLCTKGYMPDPDVEIAADIAAERIFSGVRIRYNRRKVQECRER